jgi:hypothetical protein
MTNPSLPTTTAAVTPSSLRKSLRICFSIGASRF